jgi:predicted dehydrogenase
MNKIKCAVIGVGYLGRFHAQKYQILDNVELVAICDVNPDLLQERSNELNVPGYEDYRDLFGKVDAVSIAATTSEHYTIAKDCLLNGIHVLLEKPMTKTVYEANELIQIAKDKKLKFQIGHLERFNAQRLALDGHLDNPLFIESVRLSSFNPRGTDVNVVLDLMIHDIDIILAIVNSPVKHIEAQGAPVLTNSIDIANARLTFANNCVANITASRISFKTERKTRIFQSDSYISIDYHNKRFAIFKKGKQEMYPGIPEIVQHQSSFEQTDALLLEIKSFIDCIINDRNPLVSGEDGKNSLATAEKITALINENLKLHYA